MFVLTPTDSYFSRQASWNAGDARGCFTIRKTKENCKKALNHLLGGSMSVRGTLGETSLASCQKLNLMGFYPACYMGACCVWVPSSTITSVLLQINVNVLLKRNHNINFSHREGSSRLVSRNTNLYKRGGKRACFLKNTLFIYSILLSGTGSWFTCLCPCETLSSSLVKKISFQHFIKALQEASETLHRIVHLYIFIYIYILLCTALHHTWKHV